MKGKIDKDGNLWIERAGKMRNMSCPYAEGDSHVTSRSCGHWCALFGEPEEYPGCIHLALCKKTLEFTEFTDERVEQKLTFSGEIGINMMEVEYERDLGRRNHV